MWRSLYAAAKAMTPFKRGVSDLGCGRGHDRRSGQIVVAHGTVNTHCLSETVAMCIGRQRTPTVDPDSQASRRSALLSNHKTFDRRRSRGQESPRQKHALGEHPVRRPVPLPVPPPGATLSGRRSADRCPDEVRDLPLASKVGPGDTERQLRALPERLVTVKIEAMNQDLLKPQ